jgi:phage portal protein BeeE
MLGLLSRGSDVGEVERRFGWDDLQQQLKYLNTVYPLGLQQSMSGGPEELPPLNYQAFSEIYRSSGPVFACILARMSLFSEARFQYQQFRDGRPAELYGSQRLRLLENPWPGGDTGEMLARAEQDVSLAGNWFLYRAATDRVRRLRPDWVSIVLGSQRGAKDVSKAIDAEVIAYVYEPPGEQRTVIMPEEMVHWSPIPDPDYNYRGMSWIPSALAEITADGDASHHRIKFFRNSATSNFVVTPDKDMGIEQFRDFRADFEEKYEGSLNAFKTIFIGGGSDIRVLGLDFEKMDFGNLQGAGETRIAASANVPPIVAGFRQGLEAATYSNYGQARRKFGDHFARPQWRSISNALAKFVSVPLGSRLWYDDRDIPFLAEDVGEEAEVRSKDAATVKLLIDAGYKPDAAVEFVKTGNFASLSGNHSGRVSVQLNPIEGSDEDDTEDEEDADPVQDEEDEDEV